ncbi:trypsin-like cysteine/serine peptidase domain-containing protein [Zychaea mexicana]|uniref:trypsin-like cysteine/serine peptidase domain-containing protein n=1 Tax=Zychaea mexicana TaxID=64656 RepID=UPI0022FE9C60|nr:trypsin-like cysteine/serine peptidase domain-containing protein [Zychaea mexicana]KAI9477702.1 trypsin-like cysteine/serine peptidase domain-containing protein [Zychaea mexicana]
MMHLSGILVVALLVVLIPAVVFAIQDGTDVTDPTTFPYYVMLGNPHVCGGVILLFNPAIILTAAHCVVDAPHPLSLTTRHNPYFVGYGDIDRKSQTINTITDWIVHPDYEDSNGQVDMHHDIAIVKLQKPLKPSDTVARVALWSAKDFDIPRQAELMGYGYTRIDKPEAPTLQRIAVNVTRFTAGYSDMVEAMSSHDSEMACHGDSAL